ncbi:MAG: NAD(P)-binding protein [Desulfobacterium sp.]
MKSKKVCVVGGGLGGMVAAYTLMEKGHDVTVFERGRKIGFTNGNPLNPPQFDDGIGGKCFSPTINGEAYEMGACSCAPGFSTIISLARKKGARFLKRMPFKVVDIDGKRSTFRQCYWPKGATGEIFREIMVYLSHVRRFAKTCDKKTGYRNIPECWRVPFQDFCYEHRLIHIPGWLELPVVSFGYGDLGEIETWFVFNYITATNLLGIAFMLILGGIAPVKKLEKGYQDLVNRLGEGINVKTQHQVVAIDRKQGIQVTVRRWNGKPDNINAGNGRCGVGAVGGIGAGGAGGGHGTTDMPGISLNPFPLLAAGQNVDQKEEDPGNLTQQDIDTGNDQNKLIQYEFDALVLSVPLPQLQGILDFSETEQKLAREIYFNPYTIVACEVKGVDNQCLLVRHLVHDPGHLALIEETVSGTTGFCVCYIPEKTRIRSNDEIISGLKQDLKEIKATLIKVDTIKKWDYFPRFKDADLYQVFQQLQGQQNTWYVGATAKFELAEPVAAHARGLMNDAFGGVLLNEFFTNLRNFWYFYRG